MLLVKDLDFIFIICVVFIEGGGFVWGLCFIFILENVIIDDGGFLIVDGLGYNMLYGY